MLHDACPPENLQAVVDDIMGFLDMDQHDPESWYHLADVPEGEKLPHNAGGMVEMYQTQSLWDNRQFPKIYQAFAQIWGCEELWVSNDRASMKPPTRADKPDWDNDGFIHWDTNPLSGRVKFAVQGVLYLTDTAEDGGGFRCIPGFVRLFSEWHRELFPGGRSGDTRKDLGKIYKAMTELAKTEERGIEGKAGDLVSPPASTPLPRPSLTPVAGCASSSSDGWLRVLSCCCCCVGDLALTPAAWQHPQLRRHPTPRPVHHNVPWSRLRRRGRRSVREPWW